ncbi:MAG: hypothetical protein HY700_04780 [Gemmatimonadetes bacterium]|nr:hypothetical protein [Gemmatimonadota bacterium]
MIGPDKNPFAPLTRSFSLNEAARIRQQLIRGGHAARCPRCRCSLSIVEGGDTREGYALVTCPSCGVSLMVPLPAGAPATAGAGK